MLPLLSLPVGNRQHVTRLSRSELADDSSAPHYFTGSLGTTSTTWLRGSVSSGSMSLIRHGVQIRLEVQGAVRHRVGQREREAREMATWLNSSQ